MSASSVRGQSVKVREHVVGRFVRCSLPGGTETLVALLTYSELVSETPTRELRELAASLGPDAEEAYVSTAQMLRKEERAEALVEVLTARFGPLPESALKTVHAASLDQMRAWTTRAVTSETLDGVFG
jgi:hypothetical protein